MRKVNAELHESTNPEIQRAIEIAREVSMENAVTGTLRIDDESGNIEFRPEMPEFPHEKITMSDAEMVEKSGVLSATEEGFGQLIFWILEK